MLDGMAETRFTYGGATIALTETEVLVNGDKVALTKTQRALVDCLASKPGYIRTYRMILDAMYPSRVARPEGVLKVLACHISQRLKTPGFIGVSWGRGYGIALNTHQGPVPDYCSDKTVLGYDGNPLSVEDLPSPDTRWKAWKKAVVVQLVESGVIPLTFVLERYPDLAPDEFEEWRSQFKTRGVSGLRATPTA